MRITFKLVLTAALGTVVVPALAYSLMTPSDGDPMGETLREVGFVRVPLPSNLMNVGSLYYVDAGLKDFKTACHARPADLGEDVIVSRSGDIERILERKGGLATDIAVDFGALFGGKFGDNYVHTVHLTLTDVVVEELPLDRGEDISVKLMGEPRCGNVAMRFINDAPRGYVCQVQKTLKDRRDQARSRCAGRAGDRREGLRRVQQGQASHRDANQSKRGGARRPVLHRNGVDVWGFNEPHLPRTADLAI